MWLVFALGILFWRENFHWHPAESFRFTLFWAINRCLHWTSIIAAHDKPISFVTWTTWDESKLMNCFGLLEYFANRLNVHGTFFCRCRWCRRLMLREFHDKLSDEFLAVFDRLQHDWIITNGYDESISPMFTVYVMFCLMHMHHSCARVAAKTSRISQAEKLSLQICEKRRSRKLWKNLVKKLEKSRRDTWNKFII